MWLFVVLILSSSYTASLSSMLTIQRLEPKVKDIEWVRKTNASVGCDGDSFVKDYLRKVLGLEQIKTIANQTDYPAEFDKGDIAASFLELPYQKVFMQEYCNQYTTVGPTYRFGGLGFVSYLSFILSFCYDCFKIITKENMKADILKTKI